MTKILIVLCWDLVNRMLNKEKVKLLNQRYLSALDGGTNLIKHVKHVAMIKYGKILSKSLEDDD